MDIVIISIVAFLAAILTFFSGFGLGTILMPVFAIFFPIEIAIVTTAVVHCANDFFKLFLVGSKADFKVVLRFALPAAMFALLGAELLNYTTSIPPIFQYTLGNKLYNIEIIKIIVAALMIVFALFEVLLSLKHLSFDQRLIPLGGVLSGFFGGLTGHQGALRTAFLVRLGLSKEAFLGTVVVSAIFVDLARLAVYGTTFLSKHMATAESNGNAYRLVIVGIIAAFIGSYGGSKFLHKVTMQSIQILVTVMLVIFAILIGMGIV